MTSYMYEWQLGGTGKAHRTLRAAVRDMIAARNRARKAGDQQGLSIIAFDSDRGCQRKLSEKEYVEATTLDAELSYRQ